MKKIQNIPDPAYKRIIIIGGGFAGLTLARQLFKSGYQLVLIDRNNYHQFQPLLYQVATAGLEPSAISFPFRRILQNHKRAHFRIANLQKINTEKSEIETNIGSLTYDYLVLATGLTTNFFGIKNIENNALAMKSVSDALLMRNTVLKNYERALNTADPEKREACLNFVVVGGGPTGVELAGALAVMKKYILPKDYPELDFSKMSIYLFEAAPKLLVGMSEQSSLKAKKYLEKLGVVVRTETSVKDYDGNHVLLSDGSSHSTLNLIWSAGVTAPAFEGLEEIKTGKGGRLPVDIFNKVTSTKNIFAVGDIALMSTSAYPSGHPQVAQTAIQQAINLAENFKKMKEGKPQKEFVYKDKGSLATIGKHLAVADIGSFHFQGFFAWLLWSLVHVMSIIGIKNKLLVLMDWTWNYFTYDPSLRLLLRPAGRKNNSQ